MSFRLKTILGIALIEALLLAILITYVLDYMRRSAERELTERGETAVQLFATSAAPAVIATDLAVLDGLVEEALKNEGVRYARITDAAGRVLARGGYPGAAPPTGDGETIAPDDPVYDASAEIRAGGQVFGHVHLGIDTGPLRRAEAEALRYSLLIAALEMGLVALFSFVLGAYLTRQLRALSDAADAIAGGALGYQIPVRGRDELAATARAFNAMSRRLEEDQVRRAAILDSSLDAIITVDQEGRVVEFNPAAETLTGHRREEVQGRRLCEFHFLPEIHCEADTLPQGVTELELSRPDGTPLTVEVSFAHAHVASGRLTTLALRDITERRMAQAALHEEREFLQDVIDAIADPVMVLSPDRTLLLLNQAAQNAIPRRPGSGPLHCKEVFHTRPGECDTESNPCPFNEALRSRRPVRVVHEHRLSDGTTRNVELVVSPLWDARGELKGVVEAARDITDHVRLLQEVRGQRTHMQYLAQHDALTGLPNRLLFGDRLEQAIQKAERSDEKFALLFIDLDHFKHINDSLGHAVGDQVLTIAARRIRSQVRRSDTVARLGGDEFVVIAHDMGNPDRVGVLAQKILAELQRRIEVGEERFFLTASIGICLFPQDGNNAEALLRNADSAMYNAKAQGRNNFAFYTAELTEQAVQRVALETWLRVALERQEFELHFQPLLRLQDGCVIGVEALIRWNQPQAGTLPPGQFIPLAEETGLILAIGRWVLRSACERYVRWQRLGIAPGRMAVNISMRELQQPDFAAQVAALLRETGCPPSAVEIEVTESMVMSDVTRSMRALRQLREIGVGIAVDDFGTGYSSLNYLKQLPITKLKVDRSFVQGIPHDANDMAIVRAIVALARSLNLRVLAEGVETMEQADFLREAGCDEAQGFLYSRALGGPELEQYLERAAGAEPSAAAG